MDDFAAVNSVFERILPTPKPARSCIQVARNPADVRVEIEAIARARN
jgi:enamine deaminase RidA (YjgF/YER057c/UK114 family)